MPVPVPRGPGRVAVETGRACSGSRRDDGGRLGSIRAGSGGRQGAAEGRAGSGSGAGMGDGAGAGQGERGGLKEAVRSPQGCREQIEIKGRWDVQGQGDGGGREEEGGMQGCRRERGARGVEDECGGDGSIKLSQQTGAVKSVGASDG